MVYSSPHGCIYNIDVSILLIIQNRLKLSRFRRWINAKRSLIMYVTPSTKCMERYKYMEKHLHKQELLLNY